MPPRSGQARRRNTYPVIVVAISLLLAACGSADSEPDQGRPPDTTLPDPERLQVADVRFDGRFFVSSATIDGEDVPLISTPAVEIETEFGGLTVEPGCNTYFGSFTLREDGTASFTIAGGSNDECGELGDQERAVLAALDAATGWVESDTGFRFDGPETSITINR